MALVIALDGMGGDAAPGIVVEGAGMALRDQPDLRFLLFGDEARIGPLLAADAGLARHVELVHTPDFVAADAKPSQAVRQGRNTSMRLAIDAVKSGSAAAAVSAGNTGALLGMATLVLRTLPGIDRPAIATVLPSLKGRTYILDLGANVNCTPEHLLQFGIMCSELVSSVENRPRPTVGLLNIGVEDIKGNDQVKAAAELMRASDLNFHGYVEGDDIYKGTTDIVVCDGFVGNVALKTSEGLAQMLATYLREEFGRNLVSRVAGLLAMPVIKAFKDRVDHRRYNGASLLGLRGVVVKSHGSADALAFEYAIRRAVEEARSGVLTHITARMAHIHKSAA